MIVERDGLFQNNPKPVRSKFTLDGNYSHKPRYSIAGRIMSEYGNQGTGSTRALKLGYSTFGEFINDYRYDLNKDDKALIIVKDIMNSKDHNAFSKHMYELFIHILKSDNMLLYCKQSSTSDKKDLTIVDTVNKLAIKDKNGDVLVEGVNVWDNMMSNVNKIDVQTTNIPQMEHMIYDAKIHILNKMCFKHNMSIHIAAEALSYENLKLKNVSDTIYRSRLKLPVVGSAILYGLYANYTEITSVNDAMYKCDQQDNAQGDKVYHDVILTDLIYNIDNKDTEVSHVYNIQVDEKNDRKDISALGHKARQIFILECISTGRVVEAVNMLIGNFSDINSRYGLSEGYVKNVISADGDHIINDMYGIADWTFKDAIKAELIASNAKDKDIYWMNTFVKWYHIINTCNTIVGIINVIRSTFSKTEHKKVNDHANTVENVNMDGNRTNQQEGV